jgi:hypothetical protein
MPPHNITALQSCITPPQDSSHPTAHLQSSSSPWPKIEFRSSVHWKTAKEISLNVQPNANGNYHTDFHIKQRAKLTSNSSNYNALVTFLVGPDEAEFTVHKDVVCARSTYFAAACSERWTEGRDKTIRLIDTEKATFQMYMDAMYDRLSYSSEKSSRPLIKLYILGDFLNDVKLRNRAMTLLVSLKRCPSYISIELIWA